MTISVRAILTVTILAIAAVTLATTALATGKSGETKPGWGHGDKNHVHTGPPGHSVRP